MGCGGPLQPHIQPCPCLHSPLLATARTPLHNSPPPAGSLLECSMLQWRPADLCSCASHVGWAPSRMRLRFACSRRTAGLARTLCCVANTAAAHAHALTVGAVAAPHPGCCTTHLLLPAAPLIYSGRPASFALTARWGPLCSQVVYPAACSFPACQPARQQLRFHDAA